MNKNTVFIRLWNINAVLLFLLAIVGQSTAFAVPNIAKFDCTGAPIFEPKGIQLLSVKGDQNTWEFQIQGANPNVTITVIEWIIRDKFGLVQNVITEGEGAWGRFAFENNKKTLRWTLGLQMKSDFKLSLRIKRSCGGGANATAEADNSEIWDLWGGEIREIISISPVDTQDIDADLRPMSTGEYKNHDVYAAVKKSGQYITFQANFYPQIEDDDPLVEKINWVGGEPVPGKNKKYRRVSKSTAGKHILTATINNNSKSAVVYIIWADATGFSNSHYADNINPLGFITPTYPGGLKGPDPATGFYQSFCEVQFTVRPNEFIVDSMDGPTQKIDRTRISWRVDRWVMAKYWEKVGDVWSNFDDPFNPRVTPDLKWVNDVYPDEFRDTNPWDDGGAGHLYGVDGPSSPGEIILQSTSGFVSKLNSREYVKVNFGQGFIVCSEDKTWRAFRGIKKVDGQQGNFVWQQDSTFENQIIEGNLWYGAIPAGLQITTSAVPSGVKGQVYSKQVLTSTGGLDPITWSLYGGKIPPGLTLESNGELQGIPTIAGTYSFWVKALDSRNPTDIDFQYYSMVIAP